MTALASTYTKEGFAVGADSLRMDMHGQIVTDRAVKIHETSHPDFLGAYGFSGYTALEFLDGRPMLDVLERANGIAVELIPMRFSSAQEYVERLCSKLAAKIQTDSAGIAMPDTFGLRGMFVGYTGGQAVCLQMDFPVVNGYLLRPRLAELFENPVDRFCISSGSQVVFNEMSEVYAPETLADAVDYVQDYITRCINNDTDPYCAHIGGRAQIATVTADKGFSWVIKP